MKKLIVVLVGLTVLATACGTKVADVLASQGSVSMKVDGANYKQKNLL